MFTVLPMGVSATMRGRARSSGTGLPSKPVTRSPFASPALAAGPPSVTSATSAPCVRGQAQAFGDVLRHLLDAHADPAAPRDAELAQLRHHIARQVGGNGKADADAAARRRDRSRELMPMTLPSMSNSGPPELPRLIGASVWMKSS